MFFFASTLSFVLKDILFFNKIKALIKDSSVMYLQKMHNCFNCHSFYNKALGLHVTKKKGGGYKNYKSVLTFETM